MFLIVYSLSIVRIRLLYMRQPEEITPGARAYVACRIKELRHENGITQERFALMIGLNRSYLADIEKGNRNFGIDTLDKIVGGFDLSFAEFFKGI